jgi:hypothetical protein
LRIRKLSSNFLCSLAPSHPRPHPHIPPFYPHQLLSVSLSLSLSQPVVSQLRNPEKRGARLDHSLPCRTYPLDDVTHFATGACTMLDSLGPALMPLAANIDDAIAAYVAAANTIASTTDGALNARTNTSTGDSTEASTGADVAATLGTALASCQLRAPRAAVGCGPARPSRHRITTDHPPTTDHRPPTTDHRPPTTDHRPPTTTLKAVPALAALITLTVQTTAPPPYTALSRYGHRLKIPC